MNGLWNTAERKNWPMSPINPGSRAVGLSPLAGVSDLAFRRICYEYEADFSTTEMVSAKGLYYDNQRTGSLLLTAKGHKKVGCQLFGREPEIFSKVIKEVINPREDFSFIDLNLGCPAPKIVKNGEGSALMLEPGKVADLVSTMVKASNKPVSVKFRLGFDDDHINYREIGRIAQEEGASFVCLHARTREQMYSGRADWAAIGRLKADLAIPVVGNGDVTFPEEAAAMFDLTGCDAIAIGRGAMGNPFLFSQIHRFQATGHFDPVSWAERYETMLRHYDYLREDKGDRVALLEMRKHIGWYLGGLPGQAACKRLVNQAESRERLLGILADMDRLVREKAYK